MHKPKGAFKNVLNGTTLGSLSVLKIPEQEESKQKRIDNIHHLSSLAVVPSRALISRNCLTQDLGYSGKLALLRKIH